MATEAPAATIQPDVSKKPDRRRTGRRLLSGSGGLALLGVTVALAGCGSSTRSNTASNSNTVKGKVSGSNGPAPSGHHSKGRLHVEIADNHLGTPLFSSPEGGAVPNDVPGIIKYGTRVLVKCYAPNKSGMTSVNDFYLIMGGVHGHLKDIHHTYAPADTFANGGPMGHNPDTIDPHVPRC